MTDTRKRCAICGRIEGQDCVEVFGYSKRLRMDRGCSGCVGVTHPLVPLMRRAKCARYNRYQDAHRQYIRNHAGSHKLRLFKRRVVRAVLQGGSR